MPKRSNSAFAQLTKKAKYMIPADKRLSLPRGCKRPVKRKKTLAEIFHLSYDRSKPEAKHHESKQSKTYNKVMEKVEEIDDSPDELDVVFDIQEEKKNKVYEVINVASDDETPNTITYERLYADDPENRTVIDKPKDVGIEKPKDVVIEKPKDLNITKSSNESEITEEDVIDLFDTSGDVNLNRIVHEIVNGTLTNDNEIEISTVKSSSTANVPANHSTVSNKNDSDDDIVCLAVIDAKTKAAEKQKGIEEICLSSDSDTDGQPVVPPLRLKVSSASSKPGLYNPSFPESSSLSRDSLLPFMFQKDIPYSPYFNWDLSLSPDVLTLLNEESSSSAVTNSDQQPTPYKRYGRPKYQPMSRSSSSSSTTSEDEDTTAYWQAERESRWKSNLRYEEFTPLGLKRSKGNVGEEDKTFTFKVMSYNILAQQLLLKHRHLYNNHDYRALAWPRRWNLIFNEVKSEDPDILCLQEVEMSQLHLDFTMLQHIGYNYVYKKRTNNYQDGVAVYYKTKLFELEEQSCVELYQPGVSVLDRDNVGLVLRLRLKKSPRNAIVVATTHLLYNPRRSDVKLAQVQLMLAEIDRLAYNKESLMYYPIIFTGDFNLKPTNGVYQLITEGRLDYEGTSRRVLREPTSKDKNVLPRTLLPQRLGITDRCQHAKVLEARVRNETTPSTDLYHSEINTNPNQDIDYSEQNKDDRFGSGKLFHDFNFHSVYEHTKKNSNQVEATTFHKKWVTVDYIFYSPPEVEDGEKQEEGSLQLLSQLRMPVTEEYCKFVKHMPNFAFGSDHMSLVATFLLHLNCELRSEEPSELRSEEPSELRSEEVTQGETSNTTPVSDLPSSLVNNE